MKALTVKLESWNIGGDFPIVARYTINRVKYSAVFESVKQAQSYFNNRYYPVTVNYKIAPEVV